MLLSDRRPHRGNFQTEAAAIRQLAGFFLGFAPRMAVSVSFPGIGSNYSLKDVGKRYAPPKLPLSCACLRFFVNVPEPQKQKKSAQLKALRTFVNLGGLWYGGEGGIRTHVPAINR